MGSGFVFHSLFASSPSLSFLWLRTTIEICLQLSWLIKLLQLQQCLTVLQIKRANSNRFCCCSFVDLLVFSVREYSFCLLSNACSLNIVQHPSCSANKKFSKQSLRCKKFWIVVEIENCLNSKRKLFLHMILKKNKSATCGSPVGRDATHLWEIGSQPIYFVRFLDNRMALFTYIVWVSIATFYNVS